MEFSISKATFLQGLYLAQGISDRKSTMPILANVLLRSDGKDKLLLAASDLNLTLTAELAAKVDSEGGITVGAKHLHDIVKSLPGDNLSFRRLDNQYAEIKAGKTQYKLVGMADRDFPRLPSVKEVSFSSIDVVTLRDMIQKTFFSISTDETRHHLNGVFFESDGAIARMVSTDGHRLSKVERPLEAAPKLAAGVIIPRKGLQEVRRLLESAADKVEIGFHQGHLFLRRADVTLSCKLIDAQFPPYQQVIPQSNERVAVAPRLALLEALRRVSLVAPDKTSGVRLAFDKNTLRVSSDNPDLGEAKEELDVTFTAAPVQVGFNARYFMDLLSEMNGDEIRIELAGELDPALVRPIDNAQYVGVVMPMRM